MSDIVTFREQWEAALGELYAHCDVGWPKLAEDVNENGLNAENSIALSMATAIAIMRGMQDTIERLESKVAHLESKK